MRTLDKIELNTILRRKESPVLEFKSQWYWEENEKGDKARAWGEFYKDFGALVNANKNYHGQTRYLVFGVKDDGDVCGINFTNLESEKFINEIKNKLENFFNFFPDFKIYKNILSEKTIYIFEIYQPKQILKVTKEFFDNKNICRENSIFVRGVNNNNKEDEINLADENEIFALQKTLGILSDDSNGEAEKKILGRNIDMSLDYLSKNQNLKLLDGYPIELQSNNTKVRYKCKIYSYIDNFENALDLVYINSGSNFKQLAIDLKNRAEILDKKIIVVTDRPITDSSRRLQSIEKALVEQKIQIKKILFLDDFGLTYIYKNTLDKVEFQKFKKREAYVVSDAIIENTNRLKGTHEILNEWFKTVYKPILVIQGEGGIGKTTLLEQYLNKYTEHNKKTKIIYMTSSNIIKKIHSEEFDRNIDLFDLYKFSTDISSFFTRDLLRLTLDDGHIILVLDGIDEVISNLSNKFNFRSFVHTIINEYCFNNGNCKIIFTCRNQFWEELSLNDNTGISIVTLQPFDEEKANKFFELSFNDNKKEKQALKILNKFNNNKESYIPFMLDTVKYLIDKKEEDAKNIINEEDDISMDDNLFLSSDFPLLKEDSHDYLIYKICGHEYKKYKFFNIEQQLNFLTKLAIDYDGCLEINKIFLLDGAIDNIKAISLKEHLLLDVQASNFGDCITFKYDFLKKYFLQVSISKFLIELNDDSVNEKILNSLNFVGYANIFCKEILDRVQSSLVGKEEKYIDFVILCFENIKSKFSGDEKISYASNIFILFIYIYINVYSKNPNDFLEKIFIQDGVVKELYFKNISPIFNSSKKITFNFENITFKNSHFENYDFFWDCMFNKNTVFQNCNLLNIRNRPTTKSNISPDIFSGSSVDLALSDAVEDLFQNVGNRNLKTRKNIERILRIFESNGTFKPQKVKRVNAEVSHFNGNLILQKLLKKEVIIKHTESVMLEEEYIVAEDYDELIDVVVQDNSSLEMDRLVKFCLT
ncbi:MULTISPECIES: RNA-binding domain-containing protein [Acinetobacter]|uniref:RNA-binding domain-containing protein n=1 Tax=Acinetobacter TaxID=469 RepID=UPI000EA27CDD|nr:MULTISPECIES: RNA-binding domain-containing protein [Acinetobacter]RKG46745.1 NACHT domain-containing protein [Acinetobacter cumulans]RZG62139.1 NACHT domain-containing protein [Acinetobacter sp. WCHAc060006]